MNAAVDKVNGRVGYGAVILNIVGKVMVVGLIREFFQMIWIL